MWERSNTLLSSVCSRPVQGFRGPFLRYFSPHINLFLYTFLTVIQELLLSPLLLLFLSAWSHLFGLYPTYFIYSFKVLFFIRLFFILLLFIIFLFSFTFCFKFISFISRKKISIHTNMHTHANSCVSLCVWDLKVSGVLKIPH